MSARPRASLFVAVPGSHQSAAGTLMDFLLTDPEAAKALRLERGVTAFPEVQSAIEGEFDEIERICLDFARDLEAEVSPAPLVTPADAVGFGEEFTRISQEFYFGSKDAQATAQEILAVLEGMQPAE